MTAHEDDVHALAARLLDTSQALFAASQARDYTALHGHLTQADLVIKDLLLTQGCLDGYNAATRVFRIQELAAKSGYRVVPTMDLDLQIDMLEFILERDDIDPDTRADLAMVLDLVQDGCRLQDIPLDQTTISCMPVSWRQQRWVWWTW